MWIVSSLDEFLRNYGEGRKEEGETADRWNLQRVIAICPTPHSFRSAGYRLVRFALVRNRKGAGREERKEAKKIFTDRTSCRLVCFEVFWAVFSVHRQSLENRWKHSNSRWRTRVLPENVSTEFYFSFIGECWPNLDTYVLRGLSCCCTCFHTFRWHNDSIFH